MRPKIRYDGESWIFLRTKQGLTDYKEKETKKLKHRQLKFSLR